MNARQDFLSNPKPEQLEIADTAARYLTQAYSLARRRDTIASGTGYDRRIWADFADMGWLAIPFPAADSGLGAGAQELGSLMTGLGRALVLEPYLDAVVLAGTLLAGCPPGPVRTELIETTVAGRGFAVVALLETQRRAPGAPTAVTARSVPGGFELTGHLTFVPFANHADMILVPARNLELGKGEYSIFAIRPTEATVLAYPTVDGGVAADIVMHGVPIESSRLVAGPPVAAESLMKAIRVATYCACVEAVAIMDALIRSTADYLKSRKQFGQPLANFQSLQHMLADMTIAHAQADAATWAAGHYIESNDTILRDRLLAAAKYEVGRTGRFIGQRAVHLHGGVGMTDEFTVSHQFKRLIGIDLLYGGWLQQLQTYSLLTDQSTACK